MPYQTEVGTAVTIDVIFTVGGVPQLLDTAPTLWKAIAPDRSEFTPTSSTVNTAVIGYQYTLAGADTTTEGAGTYVLWFRTNDADVDGKGTDGYAYYYESVMVTAVDDIDATLAEIQSKTDQIGTPSAVILTPVAPSGTLTIHQGVSMTLWESMTYNCRLVSGFDETTHPVKLFVDYRNGSRLVATIDVADITETASAIQVDLAPTFTSAVTREMPVGSFPAQIVAFTSSSAERHIILELTIEVKKPGFDYSAVDTI